MTFWPRIVWMRGPMSSGGNGPVVHIRYDEAIAICDGFTFGFDIANCDIKF
jgi:hypothetical protein